MKSTEGWFDQYVGVGGISGVSAVISLHRHLKNVRLTGYTPFRGRCYTHKAVLTRNCRGTAESLPQKSCYIARLGHVCAIGAWWTQHRGGRQSGRREERARFQRRRATAIRHPCRAGRPISAEVKRPPTREPCTRRQRMARRTRSGAGADERQPAGAVAAQAEFSPHKRRRLAGTAGTRAGQRVSPPVTRSSASALNTAVACATCHRRPAKADELVRCPRYARALHCRDDVPGWLSVWLARAGAR